MTKQTTNPQKDPWQSSGSVSFDRQAFLHRLKNAEIKISQHTHQFITSRWNRINQVRRPIIIWGILLALTILGAGFDVFLGQLRFQNITVANQSAYLEGAVGNLTSLNPLLASSDADELVQRLLFSRLYEYDETGHIKGDLAKSVNIDKNFLQYTITIRDDAHWHDGQKLTAEDIKYTIDSFKNQAINSYTGQILRGVRAEVLSDYSLELTLRSPYTPFLTLLDFPILPKHILSENQDNSEANFAIKPIGSGKYRFQSLQKTTVAQDKQKQILTLTANQQHYRAVSLQAVELHFYPDAHALNRGLLQGEVNAIVANRRFDKHQGRTGFQTKPLVVNNGVFAFFNLARPALANLRLRQALRAVINAEEIRQQKFNLDNSYAELDLPILKNQLQALDFVYIKPLELEAIERLMTDAGYQRNSSAQQWLDKSGKQLELDIVSPKDANYQFAAEAIAKKLQQFGIKSNLRLLDLADDNLNNIQEVFRAKNYDVLVYEISLGHDPDVFGFWHSSQRGEAGLNFSNYKDGLVDDLLATARVTHQADLRAAKYNKFVKKWAEDAPAVGLFQSNLYYTFTPGVQGLSGRHDLIDSRSRYYDLENWGLLQRSVYKTP